MGLTDTVFGNPGGTEIHQTAAQKPPGFGFAKSLFNSLPGLTSGQYPTYQGNLDPGMSPTMADSLRRAQGYAQSGPPEVLQGVQGMLGQFMSPNFANPWNSLFGNAPNYGGVDSNQKVYGGVPAQNATFQGGGGSGQFGGMPGQAPGAGPQWPPSSGGFQNQPAPAGAMPQPVGPSPFNMGSDQAAGALIKQFGGRQNLLNPLQQQYGTGDQFTNGFMHSGDHQAALQQLFGREPTFDEVQKSWRSGAGNIEAARNSYMNEGVPADRRDGWTPQMFDLKAQIDQNGLGGGTAKFDQQAGSGPVWGTPQPSPGASPAVPPPGMGAQPPPAAPAPPRMFQGRPVTTQNGQEGIVGGGGRFQPIGGGQGRGHQRQTGFEGPNNGMPGGLPDPNDPQVQDFIRRMTGRPAGPTDQGVAKPVPRPGMPTLGDGKPGRVPGGRPTDRGVTKPVPGQRPTDIGVAKPIPKPKKKTPPPVELLRGLR